MPHMHCSMCTARAGFRQQSGARQPTGCGGWPFGGLLVQQDAELLCLAFKAAPVGSGSCEPLASDGQTGISGQSCACAAAAASRQGHADAWCAAEDGGSELQLAATLWFCNLGPRHLKRLLICGYILFDGHLPCVIWQTAPVRLVVGACHVLTWHRPCHSVLSQDRQQTCCGG
jgi:hypothetical protein